MQEVDARACANMALRVAYYSPDIYTLSCLAEGLDKIVVTFCAVYMYYICPWLSYHEQGHRWIIESKDIGNNIRKRHYR